MDGWNTIILYFRDTQANTRKILKYLDTRISEVLSLDFFFFFAF